MRWPAIFGLTLVVALILIVERKRIKRSTGKSKMTFLFLTFAGWVIGVLLLIFPNMPGPSQVWLVIFKPLYNMVGLH
ncbi:hypothetical protein ADS79_15650 [Brevibacillus reuszeri]|uniref:Uncharacterized protein n=1 Tax=Brevibacillus reuszeri TaxID=54915 RepID=A0A0K9YNT7_9BACL|nr:hypothetical protein ADS79_15650 [Brevibacillus reuszeri]